MNIPCTDTIVDSRDNGFTLGTTLPDVSYTVEFACTEAGLIDMDPLKGSLTALLSGPSGSVNVTTGISGLTFPRDIQPGDTWQHVVDWEATYTGGSSQGQFIYQYLARGLEVVNLPWGMFDAMHLDFQTEMGTGFGGAFLGHMTRTSGWSRILVLSKARAPAISPESSSPTLWS